MTTEQENTIALSTIKSKYNTLIGFDIPTDKALDMVLTQYKNWVVTDEGGSTQLDSVETLTELLSAESDRLASEANTLLDAKDIAEYSKLHSRLKELERKALELAEKAGLDMDRLKLNADSLQFSGKRKSSSSGGARVSTKWEIGKTYTRHATDSVISGVLFHCTGESTWRVEDPTGKWEVDSSKAYTSANSALRETIDKNSNGGKPSSVSAPAYLVEVEPEA